MVGAENPVIAPTTVLRRSEGTCFSFPSDVEKRASAASTSLSGELLDEGGGIQGAITGFSAPAMPIRGSFTRLAEVSGDAECDRSLSPCTDD